MSERDDAPGLPPDDLDPDAPASAEEVAASQRLRDALALVEGGGASSAALGALQELELALGALPELELALSLRAAWDPTSVSEDENRAVLDATPSAEEQVLAAQLRDALAGVTEPRATDPAGVQLAGALRMAFAPRAIDDAEHRAIVERALAAIAPVVALPAKTSRAKEQPSAPGVGAKVIPLRGRATVVRVAFGFVAGGLALAASIAFLVTTSPRRAEAPLAKARTTQPLFNEPFKAGETSARIDRIASARASDFRDNRFSKWGVR